MIHISVSPKQKYMRKRRPPGKPKESCSKCGRELENNRKGKQRYCKVCHADNMRLTRPKHSELTEDQRLKANARSYLRVYIKRGKIEKQPCLFCGNPEVEAHHHDYSKPLEVTWLCKAHHLLNHDVYKRELFSMNQTGDSVNLNTKSNALYL